jgi:branched-subunit amino acid transport protein
MQQSNPPDFTDNIPESEYTSPGILSLFKIIWSSIRSFFHEKPGIILLSAMIVIMAWGFHGELGLLKMIWPDFRGPGHDIATRPQLIPGIPWDNELISFWGGFFLLVVIPILIIKLGFKQKLSEYGLGLPPKNRRKLAWLVFVILTAIALPGFIISTGGAEVQSAYPIYKPINSIPAFILYELTYFPFFIGIEFIFRGYLLFGLAGVKDIDTKGGYFKVYRYAILISMLSYTAWHLTKPVPELWGTLVWGLAAGASAYAIRSIWPIVISHWLLNVVMDAILSKLF